MPGLSEASAPAAALTADADLALAAAPPTESANPTEVAVDAALAEALGEIPGDAVVVEDVALTDEMRSLRPRGRSPSRPRPKARPGARRRWPRSPQEAVAVAAVNEVDPSTIAPGTRLVQFGTFDTAEEARAEWLRLQGRFRRADGGKGDGGATGGKRRAHLLPAARAWL
jgi:hypothetical protein